MRHYYLDRIVELELGSRAVGLKAVALNDDALHEHFPGNPVLPGIHVLEGMAQTAGVLLTRTLRYQYVALMVSVDRARFSSFARPGDVVRMTAEIETLDAASARVRGTATVDDRLVATVRITFRLIEPERLIAGEYREQWQRMVSVWCGEYLEMEDDA